MLIASNAWAADVRPGALKIVEESDGSPSCVGYKLVVSNTTLTDNADGTCTVGTVGTTTTLSGATPSLTLTDTGAGGKSFEWNVKGGTAYFANTTDNVQLWFAGPNNGFYLPQLTSCATALITAPDGKIYCGPASSGSGTVTSITQGTGMSFSVSPITSTGTINLATPVVSSNGGTGANNTATLNRYLKGDGTNFVTSTGSASGVGTPTACSNQFVTGMTLSSDAAPTSTCTTATLASAQFANQGTATTVLHGNAAGNPSFAAVNLASGGDTTGTLTVGSGGTGATTFTANGVLYGNTASLVQVTAQGGSNTVLTANAGAPSFSATPTISTLTLSQATPTMTLTDTGAGGKSFELNVKGPTAYFANTTDNIQLWYAGPNNSLYLPQNVNCNPLATMADGKVVCGASSGNGTPAGTGSELQARLNGTTFQAVTGSSMSGSNVTLGGNLTMSSTTPALTLTPGSGDSFELSANSGIWSLADTTTNTQLIQAGPNSGVYFPRTTDCNPLATGADGKIYCGSFTSGSIPFSGTSGSLRQNNASLFWDNANTRLGLGTGVPDSTINVSGNGLLRFRMIDAGTGFFPIYDSRTSRGTIARPEAVANGDQLFGLSIAGYDGTGFNDAARIEAYADAAPAALTTPGRLVISTSLSGDAAPTERIRITNAGNVGIGTTTPGTMLSVGSGNLFTVNSSGNVNLPHGNPSITLTPTTGSAFELNANNSVFSIADTTNNRQLIQAGPNAAVYFPQVTSCTGALQTGADGKLFCGPGGSGGVTSITQGTGMSFSVSPITTTGTINLATPVTVGNGGTGAATFTTNGVMYGNAASALQVTAQGASNTVLTANAGAPSFSNSPTLSNLTLNTTTPTLTFTPGSGRSFEINDNSGIWSLADTTNNLQLIQAGPNASVYFPQITTCLGALNAGADGKIACQTDPRFSTITLTGTGLSTITKGLTVNSGNGTATNDLFTVNGHVISGKTSPTVATNDCGSTAQGVITANSTDVAGSVTVGTLSVTSCAVTFSTAWTTAPNCVVTDDTSIVALKASDTTTKLTISSAASMSSDLVTWICLGN